MNLKKTALVAVIGLGLAASAYAAAHTQIAQRQAAMKEINGQMRTLGAMAQGKVAYDDFAVFSALEIMIDAANASRPLFADGTDTGETTRAKPEIWAADSNFDALMGGFITNLETALAAEPEDMDAYMPLFASIAGSCKSCHEKYRAPKE